MTTRSVVLTDHQSQFLDGLAASGRYQNASEAMRAGLRLAEEQEVAWEQIKAGVLRGLDQVMRGQLAEGTGPEAIRRGFAIGQAGATKTAAE